MASRSGAAGGAGDSESYSSKNVFITLFSAIAIGILAIVFSPFLSRFIPGAKSVVRNPKSSIIPPQTANMSTSATKTPVYFVSHGGPNVMFETEHPAYKALQNIGKEITQKVKPKAVVVFSAHWQAGKSKVEVNEAEVTKLIYDYYGFPDHYYKVQYPNVGSKDLANKILTLFKEAGIEAEGTKRGLDHGVFAPFTCMFNPDENPLGVPLVQVSLFNNEDPDKHYALGAALRKLREENILIIGSGMAVHNLRDLFFAMREGSELPYAKVFDAELKKAVLNPANGEDRKKSLNTLVQHKSARQAHPTFEHLLPVHIAAGAAGDDKAEQLFTMTEMSLSWAQYRFGDKPKA